MKNTNLFIISACILFFIAPVKAQENNIIKIHHNVKLGIEHGTDFFFGDTRKLDMVRENKSLCAFLQPIFLSDRNILFIPCLP